MPTVPMRLIGKDIAVSILDGGAQGPAGTGWTGPTWDTVPGEVTAIARNIRVGGSLDTESVRVPGDIAEALRVNVQSYSVEIELAVGATGPIPITMLNCAKVTAVPCGSLSSPDVLATGLFTGNEWSDGGDGIQTQTITVEGPAEGVPLS